MWFWWWGWRHRNRPRRPCKKKGWIPDASTILAFRHFLEKHELGAKLFERVGEYEQSLLLREGTVVDATIIHAPTSTRNEKREKDPEMHQTRKGNQ